MFLEGVHDVGHWVEDWQGNRRVWREPGRVSGRQIKELVWHLAYWCCRSRCGDCLVNEVEGGEVREEPEFGGKVIGDSRTGWLKIDGVHDMGTCGGFCSIEDSACMCGFSLCFFALCGLLEFSVLFFRAKGVNR